MDYADYYFNSNLPEEHGNAENTHNNSYGDHVNNTNLPSQNSGYPVHQNNSHQVYQYNNDTLHQNGGCSMHQYNNDPSYQNSSYPVYQTNNDPSHQNSSYPGPHNNNILTHQDNGYSINQNSTVPFRQDHGFPGHQFNSYAGQLNDSYDSCLDPELYSTDHQSISGYGPHDNNYWAPSLTSNTYSNPVQGVNSMQLATYQDPLLSQQARCYSNIQPQEVVSAPRNSYTYGIDQTGSRALYPSEQSSRRLTAPAPDTFAYNGRAYRQATRIPMANESNIVLRPSRQTHVSFPSQSSDQINTSSGLSSFYQDTSSDHDDTVLPPEHPTRISQRIQTRKKPSYAEISRRKNPKKAIRRRRKVSRRIHPAKKVSARIKELLEAKASGSNGASTRWTDRVGEERRKIFDGFREPTEPLPAHWKKIPLEELCFFYPNHLIGHVLRRFIRHEPSLWDQWIVEHMHPHAKAQLSPSGANYLRKYLEKEEIIMIEEKRGAPRKDLGFTTAVMSHPPPDWFQPKVHINVHLRAQQERRAENARKLESKRLKAESGKNSKEEEVGEEIVVGSIEAQGNASLESSSSSSSSSSSASTEVSSPSLSDEELNESEEGDDILSTQLDELAYPLTPTSDSDWEKLRAQFDAELKAQNRPG